MAIGGLFRDRDDADRFVWMRGFSSMEARREALACVLRRAGLEAARPGRQRHDGRQRRRAAAAADRAAAPAARSPARARRSGPPRPATSGSSSPPGCTSPATAPARGWPRGAAAARLGARDHGRHVAHRARREHLPRAPGPPRPRVRLDGHVRRPRVVRRRPHRPRPPPRLAPHDGRPRRPRCPRRDPPPPPHRPLLPPARRDSPSRIWLCERASTSSHFVRDYPDSARLNNSERSASLRVREAAVRNSADASVRSAGPGEQVAADGVPLVAVRRARRRRRPRPARRGPRPARTRGRAPPRG